MWPMKGLRIGVQIAESTAPAAVDAIIRAEEMGTVSPAPVLPPDVVEKTAEKYREAFRRLTGRELVRG